ncbi:MAG: asparaginase [Geminicoccaceae bacterium]
MRNLSRRRLACATAMLLALSVPASQALLARPAAAADAAGQPAAGGAPSVPAHKPHVVIVATGGTIAGAGASAGNTASYEAGKVNIEALIANVPQIADVAEVTGEQVFRINSDDFTDEKLVELGKRVAAILKREDVDGVVVTHGTDTVEETAFFLNLVLKSDKPVVMVAAMRPSTAISADGPLNLLDAVTVAASKEAVGQGVLLTMNDMIQSGRDVTKRVNVVPSAFQDQWGPLGMIVEGKSYYFRAPVKRHGLGSEFDIDAITSLPLVTIAYGSGNMIPQVFDAAVAAGAKGIVTAGVGNGSIPSYLVDKLKAIRAEGVQIVRSSRVGDGIVLRNAEEKDDENDWVVANDLNPQKARLLTALAIQKGASSADLQRMFYQY